MRGGPLSSFVADLARAPPPASPRYRSGSGQRCAVGLEIAGLRADHAEAVTGRRLHHHPGLDPGDLAGAEPLEPRHLGRDVVALDVEMDPRRVVDDLHLGVEAGLVLELDVVALVRTPRRRAPPPRSRRRARGLRSVWQSMMKPARRLRWAIRTPPLWCGRGAAGGGDRGGDVGLAVERQHRPGGSRGAGQGEGAALRVGRGVREGVDEEDRGEEEAEEEGRDMPAGPGTGRVPAATASVGIGGEAVSGGGIPPCSRPDRRSTSRSPRSRPRCRRSSRRRSAAPAVWGAPRQHLVLEADDAAEGEDAGDAAEEEEEQHEADEEPDVVKPKKGAKPKFACPKSIARSPSAWLA